MLNIYYGEMEEAVYGPLWFKYSYDVAWFSDPLVQRMLEDVDRSRYVGGTLIESDVLGPIPPETLSGGVKTLILIYENPDLVFDATSCGPNCAKWLVEIGKRKEVTVNLRYFMPMDGLDPFAIRIVNTDTIVHTATEYAFASLDCLP